MDNRKLDQADWADVTLEFEVPTELGTPRPAKEAPEAARPEGPLELVFPPKRTQVIYAQVLTDRSKLDELVRFRPSSHGNSEKQGSNGWAVWPIEILAAAALISAFVFH